mmetsp:Transcript_51853/g.152944  ORF Transcript_51853/g.152944 Transcript_51853/m.152944 type:complete len:81 (-) Transcript_51853:163-405(-)
MCAHAHSALPPHLFVLPNWRACHPLPLCARVGRWEYIRDPLSVHRSSRLEGNIKKFEKQQEDVRGEIGELQKKAAAQGKQ